MNISLKPQLLQRLLLAVVANIAFTCPLIASAASYHYTVKAGDTLSQIASQHQTKVDILAKLNAINTIHFITVGQEIVISTDNMHPETEERSGVSVLSEDEQAAKEIIAQRESGGSYTAQNGQYYGRYQLTLAYLNGDLSPENQERVADTYVFNRYGSWVAALGFWNVNGWY